MSFQAMTWAVEQDLPCQQKIVLLMLANRTNGDTGTCIPSMDRLAKDCGMSRESVRRAIKALAEAGLVEVIPRHKDGVQLSNQYRLGGGSLVRGVGSDRGGGRVSQRGGVGSDRHPNQEEEPRKEPIEPLAGLFSQHEEQAEKQDDAFDEFWSIYPKNERKVAKAQCRSKFWATVHGKRKDTQAIAPAVIIEALRRYVASDPDLKYVPAPLVWLNQARWEAWIGESSPPTNRYRDILERHRA